MVEPGIRTIIEIVRREGAVVTLTPEPEAHEKV